MRKLQFHRTNKNHKKKALAMGISRKLQESSV